MIENETQLNAGGDCFESHPDVAMESYKASLFELLEEVRTELRNLNNGNDALSSVGNISFGPDGGGIPVVAVQGEFVEQIQEVMDANGARVLISPLSTDQYNMLTKENMELVAA